MSSFLRIARFLPIALGLFLIGLGPSGATAQTAQERVYLILDGSGSMWGRVDGEPKIVVAREVIANLLEDWPIGVDLGLMTYGHRRKGDCSDIETLVPVGPFDAARVNAAIEGIKPKGKTPISASVRKAADELAFTEEKATLILVSDGLETCEADPCALAGELESKGIDFTVHVVGFDLRKEDPTQLRCLAEQTGGRYLAASDSIQLLEALVEAVKVIAAVPVPEPEPEPEPEPAGPQGLKLSASLIDGGAALDEDVFWWVTAPEPKADGSYQETARSGDARALFELPAGRHRVVARHGQAFAEAELEVTAGALTEAVLVFGAGYLRVSATAAAGGEALDADMFYWLYGTGKDLEGKRKEIARDGSEIAVFKVAAGQYHVVGKHGGDNGSAGQDVTVEAGALTEVTLVLDLGYLRVEATPVAGAAALDKEMFYWVYAAKKDLSGNRKEIARNGSEKPLFKLKAGDYHLVGKHGRDNAFAGQDIKVTAGELSAITLVMDVGYLKATTIASEGGSALEDDVFYWLYSANKDLNGNRKEISRNGSAAAIFKLKGGRYHLVSKHGRSNAFAALDVEVPAGELTEVTLTANSGRVRLEPLDASGNPLGGKVFWIIYEAEKDLDGKRKEVDRSGSEKAIFVLAAGDYVAGLRHGGQTSFTEFSVAAGEETVIQARAQ